MLNEVAVYAKLTKVHLSLMKRGDVTNAMLIANVMAELAADFNDRTDGDLGKEAAEFAANHLQWV